MTPEWMAAWLRSFLEETEYGRYTERDAIVLDAIAAELESRSTQEPGK